MLLVPLVPEGPRPRTGHARCLASEGTVNLGNGGNRPVRGDRGDPSPTIPLRGGPHAARRPRNSRVKRAGPVEPSSSRGTPPRGALGRYHGQGREERPLRPASLAHDASSNRELRRRRGPPRRRCLPRESDTKRWGPRSTGLPLRAQAPLLLPELLKPCIECWAIFELKPIRHETGKGGVLVNSRSKAGRRGHNPLRYVRIRVEHP
jgi:hypothetical protein